MAGVAGKSGRRPASVERRRNKVIDKAWEILERYFENPDISLKDKISVASKIASKNTPQEVDGIEFNNNQVVVMNDIVKDDKPLRYKLHEPTVDE